jgi:hypothetical protein
LRSGSDEIFEPNVLAKFVSVPIMMVLTESRREIASADPAVGELMSAIRDVGLATFCGRIGNLYGRYCVCPPFELYDAAQGWIARDIPLWYCVEVIGGHLDGHGRSCPSAKRVQIVRPDASSKPDVVVAWLRTVLAAGERAAAEVEAEALCAGIAPRTLDRARKRLGVTSRRIGFGRWAKYMIALPAVDGTPSKGPNMAVATCKE